MAKSNIMKTGVISPNQQAENMLNDYKKKVGEVVLVAITPRTTIELPASPAEREVRIEVYKKLHNSKI